MIDETTIRASINLDEDLEPRQIVATFPVTDAVLYGGDMYSDDCLEMRDTLKFALGLTGQNIDVDMKLRTHIHEGHHITECSIAMGIAGVTSNMLSDLKHTADK